MSTQPNMTRWYETEEERAVVEDFLAWLHRKGLFVTTDQERAALLAEYFGIDLEALEVENQRALARQAEMLAQLGYSSLAEYQAAVNQQIAQAAALRQQEKSGRRKRRKRNAAPVVEATYVAVWDGGTEVRTPCKWDTAKRVAFDIETADVQGVEVLEREFVELPGGTTVALDSRRAGDEGIPAADAGG
jgi:hypothetical protein